MRTAENHSQGQAAENLNQQAGENRNAWLKKGGCVCLFKEKFYFWLLALLLR